MNKYHYLLFDMDGTLVDSSPGILAAVQYAEQKMGLKKVSDEVQRTFLGPPLKQSFMNAYGMMDTTAEKAVEVFREYYSQKGILQCALYPGVEETLRLLQTGDHELFVATSKPTLFAEKIAKQLGIIDYFRQIVGSNLDNSRSTKKEVIQYILDAFPSASLNEFLMIGDKAYDLRGAAACKIDAMAVTYGFGSIEELQGDNLVMVLESIQDLSAAL